MKGNYLQKKHAQPLRFNYTFIPAGSAVSRDGDMLTIKGDAKNAALTFPYGRTFVLDVGNSLGEGIIDHHQPGTENQCVASMIANDPDKWIGQYLDESDQYFLITHSAPDFDALGSVFLAEKYIRTRSLPGLAMEFGKYVLKVDSGKMKLDKRRIVQPFSLMLAISETVRSNPSIPYEEKDFETLRSGFMLFGAMWSVFSEGQNIGQAIWKNLPDFQEQIFLLNQDAVTYSDDLMQRSQPHQLGLSPAGSSGISTIDCLVTRFPQSILWKYWARGDTEYSPDHRGFTMTVAFLPSDNTRAIIAVDPTTGYNLKGLGLYLDYLEIKKLLVDNTTEDITGNKRPGFHRENPWYDGRSSMHNFTIIDVPRGGSLLSEREIMDAVLNTDVWTSAFPGQDLENVSMEEILSFFDERT
jgi:hypothetical protein